MRKGGGKEEESNGFLWRRAAMTGQQCFHFRTTRKILDISDLSLLFTWLCGLQFILSALYFQVTHMVGRLLCQVTSDPWLSNFVQEPSLLGKSLLPFPTTPALPPGLWPSPIPQAYLHTHKPGLFTSHLCLGILQP